MVLFTFKSHHMLTICARTAMMRKCDACFAVSTYYYDRSDGIRTPRVHLGVHLGERVGKQSVDYVLN